MPPQALVHDESPIPGGHGLREENAHPGSGLRVQSVTATFPIWSLAQFTGGSRIDFTPGQITTMNAGIFTSILPALSSAWNGRLPVPMTPLMLCGLIKASGTLHVQIRVSGYDQFGNHIAETTPMIEITGVNIGDHAFWINMSKVFSYVDNVELRGDIELGSTIAPGWSNIVDVSGIELASLNFFTAGASSVNTLGTAANWGIGTPLRISPYGYDPNPATFASNTWTLGGAAGNNETVTLAGQVYTFKTTLTGAANEVLIGGSVAASCQNFANAINYVGLPGTEYTALTQRNLFVRATFTATTVVVIARIGGFTGNLIAILDNTANGAFGAPATALTGGIDSGIGRFPEVLGASGVLLRDGGASPAVLNIAGQFKVFGGAGPVNTGIVLGRSAAGVVAATGISGVGWTSDAWQGCPHKIGIQSADAFATSPFELNGSSQEVANTPTTVAMVGEDEWMLSCAIRSALGTRRDSVVGGSYPR